MGTQLFDTHYCGQQAVKNIGPGFENKSICLVLSHVIYGIYLNIFCQDIIVA